MNAKLIFKLLFLLVILCFLVLMGMYNPGKVDFYMPPIISKKVSLQAALMYFLCFSVGVITGAILVAGGKKSGGKSGKKQD